MAQLIDRIYELFRRFGAQHYGESVSLESHMLQTAARAETFGASPALVAAALLHDVGHLLELYNHAGGLPRQQFEHERAGADFLAGAFGPEITEPIALHVDAKRYLCAVDRDYYERLSNASRASLKVQGGAIGPGEVTTFRTQAAFENAVLLRNFDDDAKEIGVATSQLSSYRPLLRKLQRGK